MTKWHSFSEEELRDLNIIWEKAIFKKDIVFPKKCPACKIDKSLHFYFHVYDTRGRGGAWSWCSACKSFDHSSAKIPSWWSNLAQIEFEYLAAIPDYLETFAIEIDNHWKKFK